MLKFYFNGSPNPTKVALFLEEAGIAYEPIPIDTRTGDQFRADFLSVNPNGKVPAIVDGEVVVFDNPRSRRSRGELIDAVAVPAVISAPAWAWSS